MLASNVPAKFAIPFANNAGGSYIETIPEASQRGITPGRASLYDGYPPENFIAVSAGGTPTSGRDWNGLNFQITSWSQWQSAGGPITYDGTFQAAISGYPLSAIVQSATTGQKFYISTTDGNTTNPDAAGAGWDQLIPVTNKYLNPMAAFTVKANNTSGSAAPTDVTFAALRAAINPSFTSSPTALALQVLANHTLGVQPGKWSAALACVNSEEGYAVGDEILMPAVTYTGAGGGSASQTSVSANATSVWVSFNNINEIEVTPKTGGSPTGYLNPSNWTVILRASVS
jgi:hypothetical protein